MELFQSARNVLFNSSRFVITGLKRCRSDLYKKETEKKRSMSTAVPRELFTSEQADEFEAAMQERQRQVHFEDDDEQQQQQHDQYDEEDQLQQQQQQQMTISSSPVPRHFAASTAPGLRSASDQSDDDDNDSKKDDEKRERDVKTAVRRADIAIVVAIVALAIAAYALFLLLRPRLAAVAGGLIGGRASASASENGSYMRAVMST